MIFCIAKVCKVNQGWWASVAGRGRRWWSRASVVEPDYDEAESPGDGQSVLPGPPPTVGSKTTLGVLPGVVGLNHLLPRASAISGNALLHKGLLQPGR